LSKRRKVNMKSSRKKNR